MGDISDLLAREGAAAEAAMDAPLRPGTRITRGHSRTRNLQVRLNEEEYRALVDLAESRGLPVSTLVRALLLPALEPPSEDPAALIESMRRGLDLLARHLR